MKELAEETSGFVTILQFFCHVDEKKWPGWLVYSLVDVI